jgi:hypothetical protein
VKLASANQRVWMSFRVALDACVHRGHGRKPRGIDDVRRGRPRDVIAARAVASARSRRSIPSPSCARRRSSPSDTRRRGRSSRRSRHTAATDDA